MHRERKSIPRKMRPQFLVLCEGETEECYVNFLRQNYRLPIKIVSKILGNKISQAIINRYKKELLGASNSIKTFLIYDGDLPEVVQNLKKCEGILLISRPCIEIWFIAHYKRPAETEISSESCVKQLELIMNWKNYKKGELSSKQELDLWNRRTLAVDHMSSKNPDSKTYSEIFKFINILETEFQKNSHP